LKALCVDRDVLVLGALLSGQMWSNTLQGLLEAVVLSLGFQGF
jgi:hypothetical protein